MEIKLKHPIPVNGDDGKAQMCGTLTIQRLKMKHFSAFPEGNPEEWQSMSPAQLVPIVAALTGLTSDEVGEIDFEDVEAIVEALVGFLGQSPQDGKRQSGGSPTNSTSQQLK